MQIEHVAIWTRDMDQLAEFYRAYFGATVGARYVNSNRGFQSRFLEFQSGPRLELMQASNIDHISAPEGVRPSGYAHLAISVGPQAEVNGLTARLQEDGHQVLESPRWTGDGYYESKVLDPDGNLIEITC